MTKSTKRNEKKSKTSKKSASKTTEKTSIPPYNNAIFESKYLELINPIDLKKENFVSSEIKATKSGSLRINLRYFNEKTGKFCIPVFVTPTYNGYPLKYTWVQNGAPKEKDHEVTDFSNLTGLKCKIRLTSKETIMNPTKEEKSMLHLFKLLDDVVNEHTVKRCMEDSKLRNEGKIDIVWSEGNVRDKKILSKLIRPMHDRGWSYDEKSKTYFQSDENPMEANIKLEAYPIDKKKNKNSLLPITVATNIKGPGDVNLPITNCVGRSGKFAAVIKLGHIYVGAHGTLSYKASGQPRIHEMTFTPYEYSRSSYITNNDSNDDNDDNESENPYAKHPGMDDDDDEKSDLGLSLSE